MRDILPSPSIASDCDMSKRSWALTAPGKTQRHKSVAALGLLNRLAYGENDQRIQESRAPAAVHERGSTGKQVAARSG
jgi:hypothetical protein